MVEAGKDAQQGRLAAAARPDDADELARRDRKVDAVERDDALRPAAIFLAQICDPDRRAPPLVHRPPRPRTGGAPRKSTGSLRASSRICGLVRPELLDCDLGVVRIDETRGRQFRPREAVARVPVLHVEHACGVDLSVRAARRPGIVVQELRAPLRAVADQEVDDLVLDRRAVIGVAIVAHAAQIGGVVALHEVRIGLRPVGVGHEDRDRHRRRLDERVGLGEPRRIAAFQQLIDERRDHDRRVDRLVGEGERHLGERKDLHVDVGDLEAFGFQHLADLIGRHRARAVAGDDLALEVGEALDLVLEVGPQHQAVADRRRHPVGDDGDREVLLEPLK